MERKAFFFPHPLDSSGSEPRRLPGRYPFNVDVPLLSATHCRLDSAVVCADGYDTFGNRELRRGQQNAVGNNQDPCVFASPLSIVHSFCRINRQGLRHGIKPFVDGEKVRLPLSHVVSEGDVIFYGKWQPFKPGATSNERPLTLWIDTVIVVDQVSFWKSEAKFANQSWRISNPLDFYGTLTRGEGCTGDDLWQYNISDALPTTGSHWETHLSDHRIILGKASFEPTDLLAMRTSYVPLAELGHDRYTPVALFEHDLPDRWTQVRRLVDQATGNYQSGHIIQLDDFEFASALSQAVVTKSGATQGKAGFVAIPPLKPSPRPSRFIQHA